MQSALAFVLACLILLVPVVRAAPRDLIVVFVDHWEPHLTPECSLAVQRWVEQYPPFAERHRDWDGRPLRHSWFYVNTTHGLWSPPDPQQVDAILRMCYAGYGEINLHIHHAESGEPEANQISFADSMHVFITTCQRHGIALTAEEHPRTAFGFIHGYWALDDSRFLNGHYEWCGVREELRALRELGCFADYTFPAWGPMDPVLRNAIFYALDDPRPKSYAFSENTRLVTVGGEPWGDLLLFQGPSSPLPNSQEIDRLTPANADAWVAKDIHVQGLNDWVFIKLHTHGVAQAMIDGREGNAEGTNGLWGGLAEEFWTYLETHYNDGCQFRLHYATAREAYNMVKAAEAGATGNPYDYRDYMIPPYAHNRMHVSVPYRLGIWRDDLLAFRLLDAVDSVSVGIHDAGWCSLVEESNDSLIWLPSDAEVASQGGDLSLIDASPSVWYRVSHAAPDVCSGYGQPGASDLLLGSISPNPLRTSTTITLSGSWTTVELEIFDLLGRRTRTLLRQAPVCGERPVLWDGRDDRGMRVASGVYLCRLSTPCAVVARPVTVLR